MKFITILCCSTLSLSNVYADHDLDHPYRESKAHNHGAGSLDIVMEDKQLKVYFNSPAVNLLGFEHPPLDVEQQNTLNSVVEHLQHPSNLLQISGGSCELSSYKISNPFVDQHNDEHPDTDSSIEPEHIHNDIEVEYAFHCLKPSELETINLSLFDSFKGFNSVYTQWIIQSQSGAGRFDQNQHLLKVR